MPLMPIMGALRNLPCMEPKSPALPTAFTAPSGETTQKPLPSGVPSELPPSVGREVLTTFSVAVPALPDPPSVDYTVDVLFALVPAVVPVTFTVNVQLLPAAIVPPDRLTLPDPAEAVTVPLPHEPVR